MSKPGNDKRQSSVHRRGKDKAVSRAGHWVAWDREQKNVLAATDTYAEAMRKAAEAGEMEPVIQKAPGNRAAAPRPYALLEDESSDVVDDARAIFADADGWLDTPNVLLGGCKPRELLGTDQEPHVRDLLRGIRYGITT